MQPSPIAFPSSETIDNAIVSLLAGELVAFPTETVYGLGADATNECAVAKIFEVKHRPRFNPLICHLGSVEAALRVGNFTETALDVAKDFWPGPLTIIVNRSNNCPIAWLASAGLEKIALRVPSHPIARELLSGVERPIAAPSANQSGRISPTRAEHVNKELGNSLKIIIDGGACAWGLESTVVDLSGIRPILLRPGAITLEELQNKLGTFGTIDTNTSIASPGMLASHYAPECPVRLEATGPRNGEVYLGFGPESKHYDQTLSATGNLREAAANLFHMLRKLDAPNIRGIAVAPIPKYGLGAAINDRLLRASAPK